MTFNCNFCIYSLAYDFIPLLASEIFLFIIICFGVTEHFLKISAVFHFALEIRIIWANSCSISQSPRAYVTQNTAFH